MADEFDKFKAELLKNPKIKAEYDALAPEYETAVAAILFLNFKQASCTKNIPYFSEHSTLARMRQPRERRFK